MPGGKASITAGPGPFIFGQTYTREEVVESWTPSPKGNIDGYMARLEVRDAGVLVGAGYLGLMPGQIQTEITMGPSPSWPGEDTWGQLVLVGFANGRPIDVAQSASFLVDDPADTDGPD